MYQPRAIGRDLVRYRADKGRSRPPHLGYGFGDTILAYYNYLLVSLEFFDCIQSSQGAGICGGSDENTLILWVPCMKLHSSFIALVTHTSAVDANEGLRGQSGEA